MATVSPRKKVQSLSLTVLIQTKNEEEHITACIQSCRNFADTVLVVDMESSDRTRELAVLAGAIVVAIKDSHLVEASRQQAIDMVQTDWVCILDADERLPEKLKIQLRKYIKNSKYTVIKLPRKNVVFGKWLKYGRWWPDYQTRVFRKNAITWPTKIHSQPILHRPSICLPPKVENALIHHHTTSLHTRLSKIEAQASQEMFYPSVHDLQPSQVFDRMTSEFAQRFYSHEGYKDGMHGFIASKMMQYYRFIEFAKYWETLGYPELFSKEQLKQTWDFSNKIEFLRNENIQIRDSKIFALYNSIKKLIKRVNLIK